jgi:hypothetical protein
MELSIFVYVYRKFPGALGRESAARIHAFADGEATRLGEEIEAGGNVPGAHFDTVPEEDNALAVPPDKTATFD